MKTIDRTLLDKILQRLKRPNKVTLVLGARRVGKTMLIEQIIEKFDGKTLVLNGEDEDTAALLAKRSIKNYRQLLQGVDLLIVDEAHNIKDIGKKLKLMVDEVKGIRIIASGSSSFDLLNKSGEPLVGRSYQYLMYPLSQQELSKTENLLTTKQNLEDRLIYGSYPEVTQLESYQEKKEYLRDIINTYLLKDILAVDGVKNSAKMRDLLKLIAFQMGSEVSYEELGRQLGMSKNTVERYLDLLSKVFVVYRLGSFARNLRKEITVGGKWYFYDNGIRNAIINNFNPMPLRQDLGVLWESYLLSERIKQNEYQGLNKTFYFWRTYDRQEIDLIEATENSLQAFEFKAGNKKKKVPVAFANAYPEATFEVINPDNYLDFIL